MRKYLVIVMAIAVMFALNAAAQSQPATTDSSPSSTNSSQNPNSPAGDQMGTAGSMSGSHEAHHGDMGKAKTIEGCIVEQQNEYYLVPKKGSPLRLTGSEDFSHHVGHRVKVHGTESSASMSSSASTMGGASGTASTSGNETSASASTNQPGSVAGSTSSETGNTASKSSSTETNTAMAGNMPESSHTGNTSASGTSDMTMASSRNFTVDKIDHIGASCPADWNKSVNTGNWSSDTNKK